MGIGPRTLDLAHDCDALQRTCARMFDPCRTCMNHARLHLLLVFCRIYLSRTHLILITLMLVNRAIFSSVPCSRLCLGHQLLNTIECTGIMLMLKHKGNTLLLRVDAETRSRHLKNNSTNRMLMDNKIAGSENSGDSEHAIK